ncbi:MAG: hypothetical protein CGU28_14755 [Candidatus Dactylopiibacterium carminicum]|uniref:Pilus assembly protein PilX n=1 Tax=Candidatus Dactylopiibacterium carminicum TaxID=857335 RepID=A0A272ENJ9_9RHOO|nr:hypothetical protein [Candidatus Dactylopiibacterium carminicum]KAF7599125.1 hypothetical protein BGI27_09520 [Candidatus Dactylopiibacterium carminicum]PAS91692.1 MAG: hypothetical protein CGU29_14975 [Candidatus Dactylopiibacterium carminicum]PAS93758.1 MAG: hypothetical protein CGU28_14755 [Candidatus Dactylopiibacterium carminicum]PAS99142.1 MAG: hypothetical protein BSR46_09545 [Candidatus Dactylopiibacterium carminicum]
MQMRIFLRPKCQKGVILLITLLVMVVLLIASVALLRSFDTSMQLSGSLAFKRDLVNQGERGMARAIAAFDSGPLQTESARQGNISSSNYSASILPSNSKGIPKALLSASEYTAAGMTGTDISDNGVIIRTIIDRQCSNTGTFSTATCVYLPGYSDTGGSAHLANKRAGAEYTPVYRVSVRVDGPRNTQVFLQSTLVR